jgi:CRISPR/Cas system CSM-associated protein Csm3 (group 7 of RAMP superfamily)
VVFLHHRIDSLWKIEYRLEVCEDSILLYSRGRTEEAKELWARADIQDAIAKSLEELPVVFGETLSGNPVISGNEAKGIFRSFIAASLTSKGHKVCTPSTKRHLVETDRTKEYYVPEERLDGCPPEQPCFVCRWFGTAGYESPLQFSFLVCDKPFKEVMSNVVPMIAFDDEFGGAAGGALVSFIGVKGGSVFKGEVTGLNLDNTIIGALYDVFKASEHGLIRFGRLRSRGFGKAKMRVERITVYSAAPFKVERVLEGDELKSFLERCWREYSEFASKPSQPSKVPMRLVETKGG